MDGVGELGEFFINDADGLANVIRTQVDVILPEGTAVLNAANPDVVEMAELCDGKVIFYAEDPNLPAMAAHRAAGERTVFLRDGSIVLAEGETETVVLKLAKLKPPTAAHPENVLAAVAATWALDVTPDLIGAGLRSFDPNPKKAAH
jgi:cyanophycin synthetase